MTADPHRIDSVEQLRELISEPAAIMHQIKGKRIGAKERDYIERSPFLLLASCDAAGNMDVSPKGDLPGFVRIEDPTTIAIPDRPGNHLAEGHQNVLSTGRAGVVFLIPGTPETLRVNGRAELTRDPELLERLAARGRPAILATRIHVEECFFHCAKAFLRSQLWKPDSWPQRVKISFGAMVAAKLAGDTPDPSVAKKIDEAIEEDYRTNL